MTATAEQWAVVQDQLATLSAELQEMKDAGDTDAHLALWQLGPVLTTAHFGRLAAERPEQQNLLEAS